MTATQNARNFNSYFQEYQLLNTDIEINAFWLRMDAIMSNAPIEEKQRFFQQLEHALQTDVKQFHAIEQEINSLLN
jgi:hypothetical protein